MHKRNIKSFKFVKLVLLMLCMVILLKVIKVGLVVAWSQKSEESTPKEKDDDSILLFIKNFYFLFKDFILELNMK